MLAPVVAGLLVGIFFVLFISIFPLSYLASFELIDPDYYSHLIRLQIAGLQESYVIGERVNFSVSQKAGGCVFPETVVVRELKSRETVWEFNSTRANSMLLGCLRYQMDPSISRMTMNTLHEDPIVINKTGTYVVEARHKHVTAQQQFEVIAAPAHHQPIATNITLTVDVGGEPLQDSVQTGQASSLMTTYLPVNMTQTIPLGNNPIENITLYPIFADWDGIIRARIGDLFFDESNRSISFSGSGTAVLHGVNATCIEPYFVKVESGALEDGIKFENTTTPASSIIYWGDTFGGSFNEPQSGTVYYRQTGYGIVPADYNNSNDNTYRNNGAGNQEIMGTYHLSFTSFYQATVSLPEEANMISFLKVTCNINEDSSHVQKSKFPYIYVYDIWFGIE